MKKNGIEICVEMSNSGEITKLIKLHEDASSAPIKSSLIKEREKEGSIILEKLEEIEIIDEIIYRKLIEKIKNHGKNNNNHNELLNEIKGFRNIYFYDRLLEDIKSFKDKKDYQKIYSEIGDLANNFKDEIKDFANNNLYTKLLEYIGISGDPKMKIEFVLDADLSQKREITCLLNCASGGKEGVEGFQLEFQGFKIAGRDENIENYNYKNKKDPIKGLYVSLSEIQKNPPAEPIYTDSVIFMLAEAARSEPCREAANRMYVKGIKGIENRESIDYVDTEFGYITGYMKCYEFIQISEKRKNKEVIDNNPFRKKKEITVDAGKERYILAELTQKNYNFYNQQRIIGDCPNLLLDFIIYSYILYLNK